MQTRDNLQWQFQISSELKNLFFRFRFFNTSPYKSKLLHVQDCRDRCLECVFSNKHNGPKQQFYEGWNEKSNTTKVLADDTNKIKHLRIGDTWWQKGKK